MSDQELIMTLLQSTPETRARVADLLKGKPTETEPTDRKLLTLTAAAGVLGISRQTVWRMVNDGRLPTIELRAGRHRVPSNALTDLLKGGAQ